MLSVQPRLSHITSTALLCRWGQQLLEDMTSLGTDFETHAIWQGYIEEPAARDFVARKARTIALSKVQGTPQSTLFTSLEIPWGFLTRAVLRLLLSGAYITQDSVSSRILVSKKGMICVSPMDVHTRNLWRKAERGKITSSESTNRFPLASCFEKPTRSGPVIWGRMYNVLPWSAKGMRKQDEKLDSHAAVKAQRN
jgi:hypothetical protein